MDWKYILSLTPEDLNDEEKDELYNTIAWFDCETDELNMKKSIAIIKISQEIMKYKAEQVETLLAELDELATRQGEEEIKVIESDPDASKSKKSRSSLEYEELEEQYINLKAKLKKQVKTNEKTRKELLKLQQNIANLEREKIHLQNELQSIHHDDNSQSDISETVKDQYKELVDTIHQKNKQITDLLHDIEEIEAENLVLREKLGGVRDELAEATKQLNLMTNDIKTCKLKLDERKATIKTLTEENETIKIEVQGLVEEKQINDAQIEEFSKEMNDKLEELKKILDEKNEEISELKAKSIQLSTAVSEESSDHEQSHLAALQKILAVREEQIAELQEQLHVATKEMADCAKDLNIVMEERNLHKQKLNDSSFLIEDLKKQLKNAHERCQNLQDRTSGLEEDLEAKSKDINDILNKLKDDEKVEIYNLLKEFEDLKVQNRIKEKQVTDLVKSVNKLQINLEHEDEENQVLRDRLGISEDEPVILSSLVRKKRKQKKELLQLKNNLNEMEEENLELKGTLQKANRILSRLSDQILEMGGKPNISGDFQKGQFELKKQDKDKSKDDIMVLIQENEALRKGMHEILDSINTKKERTVREIKSESLEKLLKALDVKHISGWYHPAMRLQAELHEIQGKNTELREQLRITRMELNKYKEQGDTSSSIYPLRKINLPSIDITDSNMDVVIKLNNDLENILNKYKNQEEINIKLEEELKKFKEECVSLENQVSLLYVEYENEKELHSKQLKEAKEEIRVFEDKFSASEVKLKEFNAFVSMSGDERAKAQHLADTSAKAAILNRKCLYLENEELQLRKEISKLKNDLFEAESAVSKKISSLSGGKKMLSLQISILENKLTSSIEIDVFMELQKNYDETIVKYKNLLRDFNKMQNERNDEIVLLKQTNELLENKSKELEIKVVDLVTKLHCNSIDDVDKRITELANKFAKSEVNEITERQRANHTNNLYELVKEQLNKSEERFRDFEKYNKEILHKNLLLQENLKDVEDKVSHYVDLDTFKQFQNDYEEVLQKNKSLIEDLCKSKENLKILEETIKTQKLWKYVSDYELLSLKHQIVDLQADTDDKTVIARLSSDVVRARLAEAECQKKIECLLDELEECQMQCEQYQKTMLDEKVKWENQKNQLNKKIGTLQELLGKQRLQYFGCLPLTSEEKLVDMLKQTFSDKYNAFMYLNNAQKLENEQKLLKEELNMKMQNISHLLSTLEEHPEIEKIMEWQNEKEMFQLNDLKCRRKLEFKSKQLEETIERLHAQDKHLEKLEEELFLSYIKTDYPKITEKNESNSHLKISETTEKSIQTVDILINTTVDDKITTIQNELLKSQTEVSLKNKEIEQLKLKVTELEMNLSLIRKQIVDKQSQINFYEQHILDLQNKKEQPYQDINAAGDTIDSSQNNDEVLALKNMIVSLQSSVTERDESILKYQSLLKEDRDEHSKAADRMQKEVKKLQATLMDQSKAYKELELSIENEPHRSKAAIEQYFHQVHQLEDDAAELRTRVSSLTSQLQASRQEAVRWRTLANDRLDTLEQLRKDLESQHLEELLVYKKDSEKWREEVTNLKQLICKYKNEIDRIEPDFNKVLKERDDKIHSLTVMLKQARGSGKKVVEKPSSSSSGILEDVEQLLKEHEALKKRFDQLLNREKNAREEIRNLKSQLMKKPISSARSDKSDKSIKEQLHKKINALENEIEELKQHLERQMSVNEIHKNKIAEDFDKWKKQKHWQQTAEKLKIKLKEKEDEFEKLQQTCAAYRNMIERFEREKHNLENKIKNLKSNNPSTINSQVDILRSENWKLKSELESLISKLEMQQHHSGALGAAMLQDKLETQERKIAILELTAKGTVEVRAEMERLQCSISSLQKTNLHLEAENLELRLDLEKFNAEVPHFKEQIQHLESYIEVLKKEQTMNKIEDDTNNQIGKTETRKNSELERTVFLLKRVIEKLQAENKRLLGGNKPCTLTDRSNTSDRLKREIIKIKQQYDESQQKIIDLEKELISSKERIKTFENRSQTSILEQLSQVKIELNHKSQLLEKVKVLLHRAANKERMLVEEISRLKLLVPSSASVSREDYT